jgi:hypothetical protein
MLQPPFSSLGLYFCVEGSKHMQNITNLSPLLVYLPSLWQVYAACLCLLVNKENEQSYINVGFFKTIYSRLAVLQHAGMHDGLLVQHASCLPAFA